MGQAFPTVENCDVNNPEEALLPYLVGLPGMRGAPLPFPVEYLRQVSRRIVEAMTDECAQMLAARHPVVKYRRPDNDSAHWLTSPGTWVPVGEPEPEGPTLREVVEQMPQRDRAALRKHLGLADN